MPHYQERDMGPLAVALAMQQPGLLGELKVRGGICLQW